MRVEAGLDMLKFSMFNCLINFGPDYFQYGKDKDPLKRVLPIGGFGTTKNAKQKQFFTISSGFQQVVLTSGNYRAVFQKE